MRSRKHFMMIVTYIYTLYICVCVYMRPFVRSYVCVCGCVFVYVCVSICLINSYHNIDVYIFPRMWIASSCTSHIFIFPYNKPYKLLRKWMLVFMFFFALKPFSTNVIVHQLYFTLSFHSISLRIFFSLLFFQQTNTHTQLEIKKDYLSLYHSFFFFSFYFAIGYIIVP